MRKAYIEDSDQSVYYSLVCAASLCTEKWALMGSNLLRYVFVKNEEVCLKIKAEVGKCTLGNVRLAKIQISLCIQVVWSVFTGRNLDSQGCKASSCGQ